MIVVLILIFAVLTGVLIGILLRKNRIIAKLLLTFSGAFLLTITVLHILPETYGSGNHSIGVWILFGVLMQILLEYLSKGAEHGHIHIHEQNTFPYFIFIGLFLHAFIEGMPIPSQWNHPLTLSIVIHKIPVALMVYLGISNKIKSIPIQILFMILFAFASPLGVMFGDMIPENWLQIVMAIVAGIFLHISTTILFESSENHSFNLKKILMLLIGILVAYFSLHL